jgi:hypothetical protein
MDRMARSILKEHQGRFTISGKRHTFSIVGTYGRSLSRNGFDTERSLRKLWKGVNGSITGRGTLPVSCEVRLGCALASS